MNRLPRLTAAVLALLVLLGLGTGTASAQTDLGTAFAYQGFLQHDGAPATGTYDLRFTLFDAADEGSQIGATITKSGVAVEEGAFAVSLDFGAVFQGQELWLEVEVSPARRNQWTALEPRQGVGATPYALALPEAAVTGEMIGPDALQAGSNVTISRDGSDNVVISATGGGTGGFSLPYTGTADTPDAAFTVSNTNATGEGLAVLGAGNHGLYIDETTNGSGVRIFDAGDRGVHVTRAGGDGFNIGKAGDAQYTSFSPLNNGVEVGGAEGHGLHVLGADLDGVHVAYAGDQAGYFNGDVEVTYDLDVGIDLNVGGALTCTGCVDSADIEDGGLTGADVQDGSLTGADIQDNSITGADITNSLTGSDIVNGTITRDDIANNTITGSEVQDGSLTGDDIQDASLSAAKVWNMAGGAGAGGAHPPAQSWGISLPRDTDFVVRELTLQPPSSGVILAWGSVSIDAQGSSNDPWVACGLSDNETLPSDEYYASFHSDRLAAHSDEKGSISMTKMFVFNGYGEKTINLVCRERRDDARIHTSYITALFVPNQY